MVVAAIGLAIYQFMTAADAMYLDLAKPLNASVLCLDRWPMRYNSGTMTWWKLDIWVDWFAYRSDTNSYVQEHSCVAPSAVISTCKAVAVPLANLKENLGMSFFQPDDFGELALDMSLEVFSHSFLYLSVLLWLAVVVHDLSLLNPKNRNYILDFIGVRRNFPCLDTMFHLTGWEQIGKLLRVQGLGVGRSSIWLTQIAGLLLLPLCAIWNVLFFVVVACPFSMMCFARYPITLSRLLIFALCIACATIGILLTVTILVFLGPLSESRPAYSVLWDAAAAVPGLDEFGSALDPCVCGCAYRISAGKCANVLVIGIGMTYQSLLLAFRCLKGLRRSNWGNLMSVTFTVPLAVYNVEWTQPNKKTIRFRNDGEPVQAELAFDPFALMDEQQESAWTILNLQPTIEERFDSCEGASRRFEGPRKSTLAIKAAEEESIGCCGFPCRAALGSDSEDEPSDPKSGDTQTEAPSTQANGDSITSEPAAEQPSTPAVLYISL